MNNKLYALEVISVPEGDHVGWLHPDRTIKPVPFHYPNTERLVRAHNFHCNYLPANVSLCFYIGEPK